jgi:hypothetical protein
MGDKIVRAIGMARAKLKIGMRNLAYECGAPRERGQAPAGAPHRGEGRAGGAKIAPRRLKQALFALHRIQNPNSSRSPYEGVRLVSIVAAWISPVLLSRLVVDLLRLVTG